MHRIARRYGKTGQVYEIWDDNNFRRLLKIGHGNTAESMLSPGMTGLYWDDMALAVPADAASVLLLGMGGGTVARLLRDLHSSALITAVEIDETVIELAHDYFNVSQYVDLIIHTDAREFIQRYHHYELEGRAETLPRYDAVLVDLYRGGGTQKIPCGDLRPLLQPGGCIITNNYVKNGGNMVEIERF